MPSDRSKDINMLKKYFLLFFTTCVVFTNGCGNANMDKTYKIVRIVKSDTIELVGNKQVKLIGLSVPPEREAITVDYIKKNIGKSKAILVYDKSFTGKQKGIPIVYLYLWGENNLDRVNLDGEEVGGFLDVQDGLFIKKGTAPSLNAYLIRSGYACTDVSLNFEQKENFLKLQQKAKNEKLGLWGDRIARP